MSYYLTMDDEKNFGPELLDVATRAARQALAPELQQLHNENLALQSQLDLAKKAAIDRALDAAIPNWREINSDDGGHAPARPNPRPGMVTLGARARGGRPRRPHPRRPVKFIVNKKLAWPGDGAKVSPMPRAANANAASAIRFMIVIPLNRPPQPPRSRRAAVDVAATQGQFVRHVTHPSRSLSGRMSVGV